MYKRALCAAERTTEARASGRAWRKKVCSWKSVPVGKLLVSIPRRGRGALALSFHLFSFSPQPAVLCIGHAGIVVDRSRKSPGSRAAPRPGCGSGGAARGLGKGRTVIRRDPLLSSIQAFPSSIIVLHVAYLFIIGLKYLWRYLPRYLGT